MPEPPTTLRDLSRRRRERDRPTHVHVVGNFEQDPPKGLATAHRVAQLLVDEDGTVREGDYGALNDGDVAFVRIDEPWAAAEEAHEELWELTHLSRVKRLAGIVVFTEQIDRGVEQLLDARVWVESGGVGRVERMQFNAYDGEVLAIELDGLMKA